MVLTFTISYLGSPHYFHLLNVISPYDQTERGLSATGFLGLSLKPKNTVTRRWPNRLVHNRKDTLSLRDFNRWLAWGDNMPERWLEWKRFDDVCTETWDRFFQLSLAEDKARVRGTLEEMGIEDAIKNVFLEEKELNGGNGATEVSNEAGEDKQENGPREIDNEGSGGKGNEDLADKAKSKKKKKKKNKKGAK